VLTFKLHTVCTNFKEAFFQIVLARVVKAVGDIGPCRLRQKYSPKNLVNDSWRLSHGFLRKNSLEEAPPPAVKSANLIKLRDMWQTVRDKM